MSEMRLEEQINAIQEVLYGIESIQRDTNNLKESIDKSIEYLRYNGSRKEITERVNDILHEKIYRDLDRLMERITGLDADYLNRVKSNLESARRL